MARQAHTVGGDGRRAAVVGLVAADGSDRVVAVQQGVREQELELAHLVARYLQAAQVVALEIDAHLVVAHGAQYLLDRAELAASAASAQRACVVEVEREGLDRRGIVSIAQVHASGRRVAKTTGPAGRLVRHEIDGGRRCGGGGGGGVHWEARAERGTTATAATTTDRDHVQGSNASPALARSLMRRAINQWHKSIAVAVVSRCDDGGKIHP